MFSGLAARFENKAGSLFLIYLVKKQIND